jgi:two-component system sensor histidine kinase DegS
MSNAAVSAEQFLARAMTVLQATELELKELARLALLVDESSHSSGDDGQAIGAEESLPRLQKIGGQLLDISDRSRRLQFYLQNSLELPSKEDDHWPRIRVLQSQEEERMHIARALEDTVGQLLANAVFELASYRRLSGTTPAGPAAQEPSLGGLENLQRELEQGLTEFRHFITKIDPTAVLSNFGLGGGVRRYLEQYELKTGLPTRLRINANFGRLPTMIEIAIFRIIQEALDNVYNHAQASQVEVIFEETNGTLQFSVVDDGNGLSSEKIGRSRRNLGLARMIDYAELLKGKLRILSEPAHGTRVILSMPYPEF